MSKIVLCGLFLTLFTAPLHSGPEKFPEASPLEPVRAHLEANRYGQAEKILTEYLHPNPSGPDAPEASLLLGTALEKQNRTDECLRTYSRLVSRFPRTEWAAKALAAQARLLATRNPGAAQQHREHLLDRYPDSPVTANIWIAEADGLYGKRKLPEAIGIYRKFQNVLPPASARKLEVAEILQQGGGDPAKLLELANRILNEDNFPLAQALFEQLAETPSAGRLLPEIKTKLGWGLYYKGDEKQLAQAEKHWREVIRTGRPSDPWYAESKWHLVQLEAGPRDDWKKAVAICGEIIAEQPKGSFPHEQGLTARAWLLTVRDQGDAAVKAMDDLGAVYPEKMQQPPMVTLRERAVESASKKPGGSE